MVEAAIHQHLGDHMFFIPALKVDARTGAFKKGWTNSWRTSILAMMAMLHHAVRHHASEYQLLELQGGGGQSAAATMSCLQSSYRHLV